MSWKNTKYTPRALAQEIAADTITDADNLNGKTPGEAIGEILAMIRSLALIADHALEEIEELKRRADETEEVLN